MFDDTMWAFGRASGIVDLILLTLAVIGGILTRSGRPLPGVPRFSQALLHRNISILAVAFLVLHVGTLTLDPYAKLTVLDAFVPFAGAENPLALGLGTVALDLLIAVTVTALLQRWVGVRVFRAFHWLVYAMWPIAVVHGFTDGTDGRDRWFVLGTLTAIVMVVVAVGWRLSSGFLETSRMRGEQVERAASGSRGEERGRAGEGDARDTGGLLEPRDVFGARGGVEPAVLLERDPELTARRLP